MLRTVWGLCTSMQCLGFFAIRSSDRPREVGKPKGTQSAPPCRCLFVRITCGDTSRESNCLAAELDFTVTTRCYYCLKALSKGSRLKSAIEGRHGHGTSSPDPDLGRLGQDLSVLRPEIFKQKLRYYLLIFKQRTTSGVTKEELDRRSPLNRRPT